jgi:ABC-2 type transport system permease protein
MMLFSAIFKFEVTSWLKKPSVYCMAAAFFFVPLLLFLGTGGYFDDSISETSQLPSFLNSPFQITSLLQSIGKALLFLSPAIIGSAIHKDFQFGIYALLFAYPIDKSTYLLAKFTSSFLLVVVVATMPALAFLLGEKLLGAGNPFISTADASGYLFSYAYLLLPNLFVTGIMIGSCVVLTRNNYAGFIVAIALMAFQFLIENIFHDTPDVLSLFDPFGEHAAMDHTRFWTQAERNSLSLQASSQLLLNRLLWMSVGMGIASFTYRKFSLSQFGLELPSLKLHTRKDETINKQNAEKSVVVWQLSTGVWPSLFQLFVMVRQELKFILTHWIFMLFTVIGCLLLVFVLNRILVSESMTMLPLTRLILETPALFYHMLLVFATFIFCGMIVLRAKDSGMEPLLHCTPVPSLAIILSKGISLLMIQWILLIILLTTGCMVQIFSGFYQLDLSQYAQSLFLLQAPTLAAWAFLSILVFSLTRQLYVGLFLLVMVWLAQFGWDRLGISTPLLQFNTYASLAYSDFSGYGAMLAGRLVWQAYWLLWGFAFLLTAVLCWPRMQADAFKEKLWTFRRNMGKGSWASAGLLAFALLSSAYYILRAEKKIFHIPENPALLATFQDRFSHLRVLPQPRIKSVKLQVALYPEQHSFYAEGEYQIINLTNFPIDTILIKTSLDEYTEYHLNLHSHKVDSFPALHFAVYQMSKPLLPGDTVILSFSIRNRPNSLFQKNTSVEENGTFLTHDILPRIGYFLRESEGNPTDSALLNDHYQAWDSDLVNYEATVSTSAQQLALSNGTLTNFHQKNGRNYYTYQTSEPIKFNFHFNSAVYDKYVDHWRNTPIAIYHHPGHTHNLEAISNGVKDALEFNFQLFGHAPSDGINVIEYPLTEGSFSTLKTNNIIMSESVFGVNTQQKEKINLPYYVAAHEMTHHWFGNKLIPKNASGALFLTESITEYLTLQIFKHAFGEAAAQGFLQVQHQRYFKGRSNELGEESPLYQVKAGQEYISYGKGAAALYTISATIGTENLHKTLSDLMKKSISSERYLTSLDFLAMLKTATPDTVRQVVDELLLQTAFYDIDVRSAALQKLNENEWHIQVAYDCTAFEKGNPLPVNRNLKIEMGIYCEEGKLLDLRSIPVNRSGMTLKIVSDSKPYRIVFDPNFLILDRNRSNNSSIF